MRHGDVTTAVDFVFVAAQTVYDKFTTLSSTSYRLPGILVKELLRCTQAIGRFLVNYPFAFVLGGRLQSVTFVHCHG